MPGQVRTSIEKHHQNQEMSNPYLEDLIKRVEASEEPLKPFASEAPPKKPYSQMTDEEIVEYVKNKYSGSSNIASAQPKPEEPLKPFESDEERIQAKREILQELQALNDLAAREEGTASGRTSSPIKGIQRGSEQVINEDLNLWGMDSPLAKATAEVIMQTGNLLSVVPAVAAIAAKEILAGGHYEASERLKALGRGLADPTILDSPIGFSSEFQTVDF